MKVDLFNNMKIALKALSRHNMKGIIDGNEVVLKGFDLTSDKRKETVMYIALISFLLVSGGAYRRISSGISDISVPFILAYITCLVTAFGILYFIQNWRWKVARDAQKSYNFSKDGISIIEKNNVKTINVNSIIEFRSRVEAYERPYKGFVNIITKEHGVVQLFDLRSIKGSKQAMVDELEYDSAIIAKALNAHYEIHSEALT